MKNKRNYQQLHQISTATLLEESSHLRLVMQGIIAVGILIIVLIIWAAFSTIQETAVTTGEIMPEGSVQLVQHLEGGIVSRVLVSDGADVKEGQLLVVMNPSMANAELLQLRSREITLIVEEQRLRAFLQHKPANLMQWSGAVINSKYNSVKNHEQIAKLLADEQRYLSSQYESLADQESIIKSELLNRKEKLREVQNQIKIWDKHVGLVKEEFEMYEKLKKDNYVSHRDYLIVVRELNKAKGERESLDSQLQQLTESIRESEYKLNELRSKTNESAQKELGTVLDNLLEIRHKIEKAEDRVARMKVKSPVSGIIKGLRVFAGNVIQPGGLLLEVVPMGGQLLVESKVNSRDVGHIKIGDSVKVKILAYDYARYGSISGKLTKISASTFTTEEGDAYYKATIHLDKQSIGSGANEKRLKPGMTVQADINTGQKTILQYLLKPIHRARDSAFSER